MSKGRVLLVGGDRDVTRTLQVYLEAHQFSVQAVEGADQALAACRQSPPDAVILDWHVRDMDGSSLCRQLRSARETAGSFILVLLAIGDRAEKLAALEAGADDVRALPIDIEELRLRIEETLRR